MTQDLIIESRLLFGNNWTYFLHSLYLEVENPKSYKFIFLEDFKVKFDPAQYNKG